MEFIQQPEVIIFGVTVAGFLAASFIKPFLQKLVLKTETKTDDEFLAAIESMLNTKLAEIKTKAEAKKAKK